MNINIAENYKNNRTGLFNYIKSKINRIEEAEDILHDVYLQAFKNIDVTEPVENILGWLFTVANNKIIDWYRKRSRNNVPLEEHHSLTEILDIDDQFNFDKYTREIVSKTIMNAIDKLPIKQKNVFIMHAIENKTFKEISIIENVSINTTLARNRYAIKNLKKQLIKLRSLITE